MTCAVGVVYEIPLTCGKVYIGQTGRCVNDRAREHERSVKNNLTLHLPAHCRTCACEPELSSIRILGRSGNALARELMEAHHIKKKDGDCISDTSVVLRSKEKLFLETWL